MKRVSFEKKICGKRIMSDFYRFSKAESMTNLANKTLEDKVSNMKKEA